MCPIYPISTLNDHSTLIVEAKSHVKIRLNVFDLMTECDLT